jgi:Flagellar basal-body P-ring protein
VTPLMGADGEVYAIAQGAIAVGGFDIQGEAAKISRGVPTQGRISNGAVIERELQFKLADLGTVRLSLRNPDFTTSRRIAMAINDLYGRRSPSRPIRRPSACRCPPSSRATSSTS